MLPQIKKNIFQVKSKRKKSSFNFKKFLITLVFTGATVMNTAQASTMNDNEIINAQKAPTFTLSHSDRIGENSYHYSHSSHSSHSSHRSHYSSRY